MIPNGSRMIAIDLEPEWKMGFLAMLTLRTPVVGDNDDNDDNDDQRINNVICAPDRSSVRYIAHGEHEAAPEWWDWGGTQRALCRRASTKEEVGTLSSGPYSYEVTTKLSALILPDWLRQSMRQSQCSFCNAPCKPSSLADLTRTLTIRHQFILLSDCNHRCQYQQQDTQPLICLLQKQAVQTLPGGLVVGPPKDRQDLITQSAVFAGLAAWTLAGVRLPTSLFSS